MVHHGKSRAGGRATTDPRREGAARGTDQHTGAILFDQILIPVRMRARYVEGSAKVFNHASALRGSE
jgi:hypothetical protein